MSGRFRLKAREWLDVPERKRAYNERHFAEAASRYDLATRMMSLGRDAAWKRALVDALPDIPSPVCLDLACGTGDVAFLLAGRYPGGVVTGVDLSAPMLEIARERNGFTNVRFEPGDLCDLPFPDGSIDVVTGSYALRNAPDLRKALAEVHRVLSPGGVAAFLDFSNPGNSSLRRLQYLLLRGWCGFWGLLLHGTPEIHGYIAESLRAFPDRRRLREILEEHRFSVSADRRFFLGITGWLVVRRETGDFPLPGAASRFMIKKLPAVALPKGSVPKTRSTPCVLCGRDAPRPVAVQNGYRIVRCAGCGLVYVDPKPSEEDLPALYGEYHARDGGNEAGWNRLMGNVFREAADHLDRFRNGDGPPRLLDVGCGYGGFVSVMRDRGWDAEGVDPSPRTVAAASAKGIPVHLGTLDRFSRSDAAYRAITMFYVMEHLFDPMASLRKVFSLLEPGGVLLVRIPDTTPIVRLLSPFGWGGGLYDPPFHLFDFPPRVLARMLAETGFGEIRTFPGSNTIPPRFGPRLATMLFGALARGLFAGSGGRILLPGASKTTIARKPS